MIILHLYFFLCRNQWRMKFKLLITQQQVGYQNQVWNLKFWPMKKMLKSASSALQFSKFYRGGPMTPSPHIRAREGGSSSHTAPNSWLPPLTSCLRHSLSPAPPPPPPLHSAPLGTALITALIMTALIARNWFLHQKQLCPPTLTVEAIIIHSFFVKTPHKGWPSVYWLCHAMCVPRLVN